MIEQLPMQLLLFPGLLVLYLGQVVAAPLPQEDSLLHHGVASCATGVCHGKTQPSDTSTVLLNEYHTWITEDMHSRAYKALHSDLSKAIASKLGLVSAHTAKVCLDCHSDNVASAYRGQKFQISDGVGCESCHGGSEKWLKSHAEEGATHAGNIANGLYPTDQPVARSRLCLSCHLGDAQRFVSHEIMGAGHPRLSFELETFTANQPAHYKKDADYEQRKGSIPGARQWAIGMLVASESTIALLKQRLTSHSGMFPELALFECHACHHPMNDLRWGKLPLEREIPPGAVRLNDSAFQLLLPVLEKVSKPAAMELGKLVARLHQAVHIDRDGLSSVLTDLSTAIGKLKPGIEQWQYSLDDLRDLRAGIVSGIAQGHFRDLTSAEQAFLAIETLTIECGEAIAYADQLDTMYATLEDENTFNPGEFSRSGLRFLQQLPGSK